MLAIFHSFGIRREDALDKRRFRGAVGRSIASVLSRQILLELLVGNTRCRIGAQAIAKA